LRNRRRQGGREKHEVQLLMLRREKPAKDAKPS
jgi:hypothetical protein